ncbi:MAG: hypothetical protein H7259_07680 [Cytophagales bacterium]|nr:hypothetical protein [Cytophaga sp.]
MYSLAIVLKDYLEETGKRLTVKIFASDIDQEAISFASKGIYPQTIIQDVPE